MLSNMQDAAILFMETSFYMVFYMGLIMRVTKSNRNSLRGNMTLREKPRFHKYKDATMKIIVRL